MSQQNLERDPAAPFNIAGASVRETKWGANSLNRSGNSGGDTFGYQIYIHYALYSCKTMPCLRYGHIQYILYLLFCRNTDGS